MAGRVQYADVVGVALCDYVTEDWELRDGLDFIARVMRTWEEIVVTDCGMWTKLHGLISRVSEPRYSITEIRRTDGVQRPNYAAPLSGSSSSNRGGDGWLSTWWRKAPTL